MCDEPCDTMNRMCASPQLAGNPVPAAFFDRDPSVVAPDLLGMWLVSDVDGIVTGGRIVETEAYLGSGDPGSHASTKGITARNAVMYGPPGTVYVYFTYGNHHMVNLVCCREGQAGAVLLRAIEPEFGVDAMTGRRKGRALHELTNGPGKLAAALGIDLSDNGSTLGRGRLRVVEGEPVPRERVRISGRIGLSEGHDLDLRFYDMESSFVSRGRTGPLKRTRRHPKKEST